MNLQPVPAAFQPVEGKLRQHLVGLRDRSAERDHDDDVVEAEFLTRHPHGPALESEPLAVSLAVITACAAPAEHRVLLLRFESRAADQPGVFVRLEVAHAHDHGLGVVRGGDPGDPAGERPDKVGLLVRVSRGQFPDRAPDFLVLDQVKPREGHRMDPDHVPDDELHAGQADPVARQAPPAEGGGGVPHVDHESRPGLGDPCDVDLPDIESQHAVIDGTLVPPGATDGDVVAVFEALGRVTRADDRREAQFPADDGRVAGASAVIGHDRGGLLHDRQPIGVGHSRHQDRPFPEAGDLVRALEQADLPCRNRVADGEAGCEEPALFLEPVGFE